MQRACSVNNKACMEEAVITKLSPFLKFLLSGDVFVARDYIVGGDNSLCLLFMIIKFRFIIAVYYKLLSLTCYKGTTLTRK